MRWLRGILHGMQLVVFVSLRLGMVIAAMGAWFAIQGGSPIDLRIGLVILLAGFAILRSHSIAEFFLLALLGFVMIAWSISRANSRIWMLSPIVELSGRIILLLGFLLIMRLAFFVVHRHRVSAGLRPVLAASSRASVIPGWTKASNMATHLQRQNP